ncbi:MAG: hypothetical protein MK236_03200 [Pedosphaera sp.]|nr:hypothetical protein [Pedosphaera sp.]
MKSRVFILGVVVSLVAGCATTSQPPVAPQQRGEDATSDDMMLEVVVRPLSLISTIAGSAIYVVTWPFSMASGSAQEAKRLLVDKPYEATFGRKMGDFQKLKEIKDRP